MLKNSGSSLCFCPLTPQDREDSSRETKSVDQDQSVPKKKIKVERDEGEAGGLINSDGEEEEWKQTTTGLFFHRFYQ